MELFYRTQLENDIILADDIVPEAMPAANSRGERARDRMLLLLAKAANSNAMDFSEMASDYCISHCKPFIASTILPEEAECMKICHSKFINSRRIISKQVMNTVGYNAYLMRAAIANEDTLIEDHENKYPFEQYQIGRRQRDPHMQQDSPFAGGFKDPSISGDGLQEINRIRRIQDGLGKFTE
jgi:hypothetical protein